MLEDLCTVSNCKKFKDNKCLIWPEGGRQYRMRYGYCPIPDYPHTDKDKTVWREGQKKQVKIKKR